ncbi:transcriptional regulator, HxlR family [Pedobacter westerhofensis]|uniref:Transcriptional regulator, HxlR family n=1 Tax=Pedobacter westerhofensis TaxID=425512 RepID=A0A521FP87_9SPHI|nr:helix-turn-helix domain-containing protein [Pedobacter westerhofensis]SMO97281.1 transcriptional regulator, HxlR family [Pedobacter westerhofensis]
MAKDNKIEAFKCCPIDYGFKRIGGKYKGRILYYLYEAKVLRYGELSRAVADITTKMLTQSLKELEADGLINREMFPVVPPKVEYSITDRGRKLIPFIKELMEWSLEQMKTENISPIFFSKPQSQ